jgi:hypothetical protein
MPRFRAASYVHESRASTSKHAITQLSQPAHASNFERTKLPKAPAEADALDHSVND